MTKTFMGKEKMQIHEAHLKALQQACRTINNVVGQILNEPQCGHPDCKGVTVTPSGVSTVHCPLGTDAPINCCDCKYFGPQCEQKKPCGITTAQDERNGTLNVGQENRLETRCKYDFKFKDLVQDFCDMLRECNSEGIHMNNYVATMKLMSSRKYSKWIQLPAETLRDAFVYAKHLTS